MNNEDNDEPMNFTLPFGQIAEIAHGGQEFVMLMLYFLGGFMSIFTAPFEMVLRPRFGSLYLNPLAWLVNLVVVHLWVLAGIGMYFTNLPMRGLIGVEWIMPVYWVLSLWHVRRIWHLINHMKEENDSEEEGEGWGIFQTLPTGYFQWRRIRCIYEPGLIIIVGTLLFAIRVFKPTAYAFFLVGGFALFTKCSMFWIINWYSQRRHLDKKYRNRRLAELEVGQRNVSNIGAIPVLEMK